MEKQYELSPDQRDLQARIAHRRAETIRRILSSGVQASERETMDKDAEAVIARLYDTSLSDADISSCISILEMLLFLEGLPPLLNVMKDTSYSISLRTQAAKAIAQIGSNHIEGELREMLSSDSPQLRSLAEIALKHS